jgi:predicted RNase H-like nuclease
MLQASVARECVAGLDDLVDACAAAWTAARIAQGKAISFPDPPERDAFGLPIAIWA